jgi:hypothetical protein
MSLLRYWFAALVVWGLFPLTAQAHFLFVYITPVAEAGRAAEVYFSATATAGDSKYIDKIANTRLWMQSTPGEFVPLTIQATDDRLRASLAAEGPVSVIGVWNYGVLEREKAFLLRHYPKAVSGPAESLNRMKRNEKIPLEIMPTFADGEMQLVVLRDGKPIPHVQFETVDLDLDGETFKADAQGRVTWRPSAPGRYCVYTHVVLSESGEHEEESFEEIREFATLSFDWPLVRDKPDEEAVRLFEEALSSRAHWKNFPGFRAKIVCQFDGREEQGTLTVDADGGLAIDVDDAAVESWIEDQLASLAMHRISDDEADRPALYVADDGEDHPLGPLLIFLDDQWHSSYRVKDRQITVVNRRLGARNMSITVLDNHVNEEGQFLPHCYTVQYWDAKTGEPLQTQTSRKHWIRLGSWDLPLNQTVTVASKSGLSVRRLVLKDHELLKVPTSATGTPAGK